MFALVIVLSNAPGVYVFGFDLAVYTFLEFGEVDGQLQLEQLV